jgi:hypothetical protein
MGMGVGLKVNWSRIFRGISGVDSFGYIVYVFEMR